MTKLQAALLADGKTLQKMFLESDELIAAGELDYTLFSSPTVRKAIYLQRELSRSGTPERYDERKANDFRARTKRFLTELKDGGLTRQDCIDLDKSMKAAFPKLSLPREARK